MKSIFFVLGVFGLTCLVFSNKVSAAPVTFNTALPVAKEEFIFRELFFYGRSGHDSSDADRNQRIIGTTSVLGYGVSPDLAVFFVLPYFDKQIRTTTGSVRSKRKTHGFGDIRSFARYTLYRKDEKGKTCRLAAFGGIQIPSAEDNKKDDLGRIPTSVQLGLGIWSPFTGVNSTYSTLDYQIDSQLFYQWFTTANHFRVGNIVEWDASLQYRIWPCKLTAETRAFLYLVCESNLIYQEKDKVNGSVDSDSGGTVLFIDPGLQYVTLRWIVEAVVGIPIYQNLNGSALEKGYFITGGFRFNF